MRRNSTDRCIRADKLTISSDLIKDQELRAILQNSGLHAVEPLLLRMLLEAEWHHLAGIDRKAGLRPKACQRELQIGLSQLFNALRITAATDTDNREYAEGADGELFQKKAGPNNKARYEFVARLYKIMARFIPDLKPLPMPDQPTFRMVILRFEKKAKEWRQ
jgi:hypothetical protein